MKILSILGNKHKHNEVLAGPSLHLASPDGHNLLEATGLVLTDDDDVTLLVHLDLALVEELVQLGGAFLEGLALGLGFL